MPKISDIMLFEQKEQFVLCIRVKTDINNLGSSIGSGFAEIASYLHEMGELMTDLPFVGYENYENMNESNINIILGFPVAKPLEGRADIKCEIIPSSKIITCMFRGDYAALISVYAEMEQWMKDNGFESSGTAYEYYYNDEKYPKEDYLTRIVIPVK